MTIENRRPLQITAVAGSPRAQANSDFLLDSFLRGAKFAGGSIEKYILRDLTINPCNDCGDCEKDGVCKIHDDQPNLAERIRNADIFVLAAPVYWCGFPGMTKNFVDRFQAHWSRHALNPSLEQTGPKGYLLSVGGAKSMKNFDGMRSTFHYLMETLQGKITGTLLCPAVEKAGEILDHPNLLRKAFEMGYLAVTSSGEKNVKNADR